MEKAAELLAKVLPASSIDDAVLDAIALSVCADGVTQEELEALTRMARELPSLEGRSDADVEASVRAAFERIHRDGLEGRLRALGEADLDADARRRVFCAATIVQYADGHVTNEENEFLLDLADVLGLDEVKVREIVAEIERELGVTPRPE